MKIAPRKVLSIILSTIMMVSNITPVFAESVDPIPSVAVLKSGKEINGLLTGLGDAGSVSSVKRSYTAPDVSEQIVNIADDGSVLAWYESEDLSVDNNIINEAMAETNLSTADWDVSGGTDLVAEANGDLNVISLSEKESSICLYTDAAAVRYPEDISEMFKGFSSLHDISGLAGFDVSDITVASDVFDDASPLTLSDILPSSSLSNEVDLTAPEEKQEIASEPGQDIVVLDEGTNDIVLDNEEIASESSEIVSSVSETPEEMIITEEPSSVSSDAESVVSEAELVEKEQEAEESVPESVAEETESVASEAESIAEESAAESVISETESVESEIESVSSEAESEEMSTPEEADSADTIEEELVKEPDLENEDEEYAEEAIDALDDWMSKQDAYSAEYYESKNMTSVSYEDMLAMLQAYQGMSPDDILASYRNNTEDPLFPKTGSSTQNIMSHSIYGINHAYVEYAIKHGYTTHQSYDSGWSTNLYTITTNLGTTGAICVSPNLPAPPDGEYKVKEAQVFEIEDPLFVKVLYYGTGSSYTNPPLADLKTTHIAAAKVFYTNVAKLFDWSYRASQSEIAAAEAYIARVKKMDLPEGATSFLIRTTNSGTQYLAFPYVPDPVKVRIQKVSSDPLVSGTGTEHYTFDMAFKVENEDGKVVWNGSCSSDTGYSPWKKLAPGTYTAYETAAPKKGFVFEPQMQTFMITGDESKGITVTFHDRAYKHGHIILTKYPSVGDQKMKGAEYRVDRWSNRAGGFVAVSNAWEYQHDTEWKTVELYADSDNPDGRFKITETKRPVNAVEPNWSREYYVGDGDFIRIARYKTYEYKDSPTNDFEKEIVIRKEDKATGERLEGAEFDVLQYSPSGNYVFYYHVGSNDYNSSTKEYRFKVVANESNSGMFKIVETKWPDGFEGEFETYFRITYSEETTPIIFKAQNVRQYPYGRLSIDKTDAETGERIPTPGAVFKVYEYSKALGDYKSTPIDTLHYDETDHLYKSTEYGTNAFGREITALEIRKEADWPTGTSGIDWNEGKFKVVEEDNPEGWINDHWTQEFELDNSDKAHATLDSYEVVETPNKFRICKRASDRLIPVVADFDVTFTGGKKYSYTIQANGQDVVIHGGKTTIRTDEDGWILLEHLPEGNYIFTEHAAITPGYKEAAGAWNFSVDNDGIVHINFTDEEGVVYVLDEFSAEIDNPPCAEILITKEDTKDLASQGIDNNDFPYGTVFKVYPYDVTSGSYSTTADMTIVYDPHANNEEGMFVDEATGVIPKLIYTNETEGKYEIREVKQTPGYLLLNPEPQYIEVPSSIPVGSDPITLSFTFENTPNLLRIKKVDPKGNVLVGATFAVTCLSNPDLSKTGITGDDGYVQFDCLAPGNWTYMETIAPSGYVSDGIEHPFKVENDGRITITDEDGNTETKNEFELSFSNNPTTKIRIQKVDAETGLTNEASTGFPAKTVFGVYEWDENLGDYRSEPSGYITYGSPDEIDAGTVALPDDFVPVWPQSGKGVAWPKTGSSDDIVLSGKDSFPFKDVVVNEDDIRNIDFEPMRLIVLGSSDVVVDKENVIASYNDFTLLQYDSVEHTKQAYVYYSSKADAVSVDVGIKIADNGTEYTDMSSGEIVSENSNPFITLEEEIAKDNNYEIGSSTDEPHPLIALIDTGASEGANVVGRVSVLGGTTDDDNGHGDAMLSYILEEDPEARVISIKALDETGHGTISSVVAAMEYAESCGAKIINLSMTAFCTEENAVLEEVINRIVHKDIAVITAAGNYGMDAKYFIPACVDEAIVVGAWDESTDSVLKSSNSGPTVDFYLNAGSTSEAAARASGMLSVGLMPENNTVNAPETDIDNIDLDKSGEFSAQAYVPYSLEWVVTGFYQNNSNLSPWNNKSNNVGGYAGYSSKTSGTYPIPNDATHNPAITGLTKVTSSGGVTYSNQWVQFLSATTTNHNAGNASVDRSSRFMHFMYYYTPTVYTVTYQNLFGATNTNPTTFTVIRGFNLANPGALTGFTFSKWTLSKVGGTQVTAVNDPSGEVNASAAVGAATGSQLYVYNDGSKSDSTLQDNVSSLASRYNARKTGWDNFVSNKTKSNITLYANWVANEHIIAYAGMTGATYGTNHPTSGSYNTEFTVDNPTKSGARFTGWNITGMDTGSHIVGGAASTATSATGITGTKFKNLNATAGSTVTFTATWAETDRTATFDANGGTLSGTNTISGAPGTQLGSIGFGTTIPNPKDDPTATNPIRRGYTFKGWFTTNASTGGEEVTGLTTMPSSNVIYYARWEQNKYTLKIDPNGGRYNAKAGTYTVSTDAVPLYYNSTNWYDLSGVLPVRRGYELEGLYSADGYKVFDENGLATTNGNYWSADNKYQHDENLLVVAHWAPVNYTITLDYNDGERTPYVRTYNVTTPTWTIPNPTRSGFAFAGWSSGSPENYEGIYGTAANVMIPLGSIGNRVYVANWVEPGAFVDPKTQNEYEFTTTKTNLGKLKVREEWSTPGYILDYTEVEVDVSDLQAGEIKTVSFTNKPNDFEIEKIDEDNNVWAGVGYTFTKPDGSTFVERTQANGILHIDRLDQTGVWTYQELDGSQPEGLTIDPTVYSFVVSDGTDGHLRYEVISGDGPRVQVNPREAYVIYKATSDGERLPGIRFTITKPDGTLYDGVSVTDSNGIIMIPSNVLAQNIGTWTFQEAAQQPEYTGTQPLVIDDTVYSFVVSSAGTVTGDKQKTVVNDKINFRLIKRDEETNEPLAGAKFMFRTTGFEKEYVSDANGCIVIASELKSGAWTFKETSAPAGYILDETEHSMTVSANGITGDGITDEGDGWYSYTATNKKTTFELIKKDADTDETLDGVKFNIYNGSTFNKNFVTQNGGKIEIKGLAPGKYFYREIETLPGYILDPTVRSIDIVSGETPNVITATNKKNSFKLLKVDSNDRPITNNPATFQFTSIPSAAEGLLETNKDYTTNADGYLVVEGQAEFRGLPTGVYTLEEKEAPDRFRMNSEHNECSFEVLADGTVNSDDTFATVSDDASSISFRFENLPVEYIYVLLEKEDAKTREKLEGDEFSFEILVKRGNDYVSFDTPNMSVYDDDDLSPNYGKFTFDPIDISVDKEFKIVERAASAGYIISYEHEFTALDGVTSYQFVATNEANEVEIIKVDKDGNPLSDVTFDVGQNQNNMTERESKDGVTTLTGLVPGTWYYRENHVPEGFLADEDENGNRIIHSFVVTDDGYILDKNNVKQTRVSFTVRDLPEREGTLKINKVDENGAKMRPQYDNAGHKISEVSFRVYAYDRNSAEYDTSSYVSTVWSDSEEAYVPIAPLPINSQNLGRYKVVETATLEGYTADYEATFHFDLSYEDEAMEESILDVVNYPNELKVRKVDEDGRPLAGAQIRIRDKMDNYYGLEDDAYFHEVKTSGTDGYVNFGKLPEGVYTITEIGGVPGHLQNPEERTVIVDDKGFIYEEGDESHKARSYEMRIVNPKNLLRVLKLDSATRLPIEGVTFSLVQYTGEDGIIGQEVGPVGTKTTDANGVVEFGNLEDGYYYLQETAVPAGYTLCEKKRLVIVRGGGIATEPGAREGEPLVPVYEYTIWNGDEFTVSIKAEKVDSETNESLEGAVFGVWALDTAIGDYHEMDESYTAEDGNTWPVYLVYRNGYYVTDSPLPATQVNQGKFLIKEVESPAGYTGNFKKEINGFENNNFEFTLEYDSAIPNDKTGIPIEIRKYDASITDPDDGSHPLLDGAEFDFWEADTENKEHHVTGEEEHGKIFIHEVKHNTVYYLQETKPPKGYIRNTSIWTIFVDGNGYINSVKPTYVLEIPNYPVPDGIVLRTGGLGRRGIYLLGGGMAVLLTAIVIFRKKKKKKMS